MTLSAWLSVVGICSLGAMSPGPSLAVVLKHTLSGGRPQGSIAALSHAAGVGLYAFLSMSGLAAAIIASERLFTTLQWLGALYLAWLGIKSFLGRARPTLSLPTLQTGAAARDGFMIVFLNPKIALFFIALFSQFVGADTALADKLLYAVTAMFIDGLWYLIVAWLFSSRRWLERLQAQALWIDRLFGAVLLLLAGKLAIAFL